MGNSDWDDLVRMPYRDGQGRIRTLVHRGLPPPAVGTLGDKPSWPEPEVVVQVTAELKPLMETEAVLHLDPVFAARDIQMPDAPHDPLDKYEARIRQNIERAFGLTAPTHRRCQVPDCPTQTTRSICPYHPDLSEALRDDDRTT